MSRVETALQLAKLEEKREALEKAIRDADSGYFDDFEVTVEVKSRDFTKETTEPFTFVPDQSIFIDCLKRELQFTKNFIAYKIKALTE